MISELRTIYSLILKYCLLYIGIGIVVFSSCIPIKRESSSSGVIDLSAINIDMQDSTVRRVFNAQNDQNLTALYSYFNAPSVAVRYVTAQALGSVRDSSAADTLATLLNDENIYVASAAAYSLGLIGVSRSQSVLINAFHQYDTSGISAPLNGAILEAIGRLGTADFLHAMATVQTYKPSDTLLLLGQIRGIYRYMLRGMTDAAGTSTAVRYLSDPSFPHEVRLMAAHYLARGKNLDLTANADVLISTFNNETDQDIKLPLILAVGKTKTEAARSAIFSTIEKNQDERLSSNAIRALSNFDYVQVKPILINALRSNSIALATTALAYLNDFGREADANDYRNVARENLPWQIKVPLLAISNKNYSYAYAITKGNINGELKSILSRTENIQEKIACIKALGTDPKNINFLLEIGGQSGIPAIHAAVMEAGLEAIKSKYFTSAFGGSGESMKKNVIDFIQSKLISGDEAALEIIESAAKDETLKKSIDAGSLEQIKSTLSSNPYAVYMLTKTLNTLRGSSIALTPMSNYKKLNAEDFKMNGVNNFAEIITDKGTIKIRLLKNIAPATVMNFARLGKSEFFNGKNFHRVVPNFVIQGGCPRGDGYGSMDYTIRSETPPIYYNKAGMVGMASSGNHTESCQFFITHSPTPHLDGNYTIFAEVVSGMDIVNAIQIGDKIQRINFIE
jgi:cyclophilin family peptidyl-prolyl cis-trans isomerase/HEAT repeat protein